MNLSPRPNRTPPTNSEWNALSKLGRLHITIYCWQALHRPMWPVFFSLGAGSAMFYLLAWLPTHPMNIPISIGAGLSISLITRGLTR